MIIGLAGGGNNQDSNSFNAVKSLKILRFVKLGRLLKLEKILANLDRETLDNLEDFLQRGSTKSGMVILRLTLAMAYACHLMACGFVYIGKVNTLYTTRRFDARGYCRMPSIRFICFILRWSVVCDDWGELILLT